MAILGTGPNDGRTYGGYVAPADDRYPNDPAADSMEAMQEYHARQDAEVAQASPGILAQAAAMVAAGSASTVASAVWTLTRQAGYRDGRSDAHAGYVRDITGASEGYVSGYRSGRKWALDHPAPVSVIGSN